MNAETNSMEIAKALHVSQLRQSSYRSRYLGSNSNILLLILSLGLMYILKASFMLSRSNIRQS